MFPKRPSIKDFWVAEQTAKSLNRAVKHCNISMARPLFCEGPFYPYLSSCVTVVMAAMAGFTKKLLRSSYIKKLFFSKSYLKSNL